MLSEYLRPLLIPMLEWSGINSLLYYSPLMMHSMGLEGATVELISSGFVSIVQLLAVVPAILYIDRLGE